MDEFAIDLDKVLDEFEETEGMFFSCRCYAASECIFRAEVEF